MILAAMTLAAHWVAWPPELRQKGVAIGAGVREHLIIFLPDGDCRRMRVFSGNYGDIDKAREFIWRSKFCQHDH